MALVKIFVFENGFWDSPISGLLSRQNYRNQYEKQLRQARSARGNRPRPRPPRSSLVYSKHSEEDDTDQETLQAMRRKEELEELEREASKVRGEVGYLYFVGEVDGLMEWNAEFLKSDRELVYRKKMYAARLEPETSQSNTDTEESEASAGSESEWVDETDIDEE
jgi:hypothetical protein